MKGFLLAISGTLLMVACGGGEGGMTDATMEVATDDGQAPDAWEVADTPRETNPEDDSAGEDVTLPIQVLGLPLVEDGVLYAGAAAVDITPDLDGPDTYYLAGFGKGRPATEVRDPVWARALVLSRDREYAAVVVLDLVGITGYRCALAAKALDDLGWDGDRVLIHATHTHAAPDSIGLWGEDSTHSGLVPAYQDRLVEAIVSSVQAAAASAVPVSLRAGAVKVGSISPYFTSPEFGGKGPVNRTTGLIRDTRDPVTSDDTLTAIGFQDGSGQGIASIVHVHTHVEVSGGGHHITSDFAHAARELLEDRLGGTGMVWIGAEGGLQTPLSVPLPATDPLGAILWATCDEDALLAGDPECDGAEPGDPRLDADGDPIPTWTPDEEWERTDSYGRFLGGLAVGLLEEAAPVDDPALRLTSVPLMLPIQNRYLQIFGRKEDTAILDPLVELVELLYPEYMDDIQDIYDAFEATLLDYPQEHLVVGEDCPLEAAGEVTGCLPTRMWSLELGPVHLLTAPGELLPELWMGTPDGAEAEYEDASLRGPGSTWFGYTDPDCAGVPYEECRDAIEIGDCDCLNAHATPYVLSYDDPDAPPLKAFLGGQFPVLLGLTGEMTGYIVPEPDCTVLLSRPLEKMFSVPFVLDTITFAENAKEHYEESVSLGPALSTRLQDAADRLFMP